MSVPRLLRVNRPFRDYWTGQTISLFGDQIALLAVPLLAVLTLHADAQQMGFLAAVELAPSLFFAVHLGVWADRRRSRRALLVFADLGRAALLLGVPIAALFGVLSMPILYVVAFLTGTLGVLFMVAEQTVFTSLVRPGDYVEANSLLIGSRSVAVVGGKTLGGLLVAVLTAPVAIAVDGLSFIASALFVRRVEVPEPPAATGDSGGLAAGIRFVHRTPLLQASLLGTATFNIFNTAFWALLVLFATRELGLGSGAIGIALGVGALGSVLGSAVAQRVNTRIGLGNALIWSFILAPLPLFLVPLASGPPVLSMALLTAAEFFSGVGVMVLDVGLGSMQAAVIPDQLRSRVWGAILFVNWGVRPLGALGGGLLAGSIGLRPTMWIAAIGGMAGVLWLIPSRMSDVEDVSEEGLALSSSAAPLETAIAPAAADPVAAHAAAAPAEPAAAHAAAAVES
ncbi:MAG TPA: MFS transporter [Solirubrobacterales bacterium]|jgi:MFS family permease|nr:MFS transporter [Solirubrobacterales bacterium]